MGKILFYSSLVLDLICFLEKRNLTDKNVMNSEQINTIEYINDLIKEKMDNKRLSMSSLCLVLSAYTNNENLENLTIDDSINIFSKPKDIENIVKQRITNEFVASYTYPMLEWLNDGWSDIYIRKLKVLKSIGFEQIWKEKALPSIKNEITQKTKEIDNLSQDSLFNNIASMKNIEQIQDVKIFISYFSFPTAFKLYNTSFLTCFLGKEQNFVPLIAHELMHGFANDKLIELYKTYVESDSYLSDNHKKLINDLHSGDEEEFVMAAEYYLCLKANISSKEDLLKYSKKRYGGCCPVSTIIFDLLSKEKDVPRDYNKWLKDKFENNILPNNDIEDYVKNL